MTELRLSAIALPGLSPDSPGNCLARPLVRAQLEVAGCAHRVVR